MFRFTNHTYRAWLRSVLLMSGVVLFATACSSADYESDELWASPPPKPAALPKPVPPPEPEVLPVWNLPPPKGLGRWDWWWAKKDPAAELLARHAHDSVPPDAPTSVPVLCTVSAKMIGEGPFKISSAPDIRVQLFTQGQSWWRDAIEWNIIVSEVLFQSLPVVDGAEVRAKIWDEDSNSADDLLGEVVGVARRDAPFRLEGPDGMWMLCRFVSPGGLQHAVDDVRRRYRAALDHYRRFVPEVPFERRREGPTSLDEVVAAAEPDWWEERPVPDRKMYYWLVGDSRLPRELDAVRERFLTATYPYLIKEPGWVEVEPGFWMRLRATQACTMAVAKRGRDDICVLEWHLVNLHAQAPSIWCEPGRWKKGRTSVRIDEPLGINLFQDIVARKRAQVFFKQLPADAVYEATCGDRPEPLRLPVIITDDGL